MNKCTPDMPHTMPAVRPASEALALEKSSKRRRLGESSQSSKCNTNPASDSLASLPDLNFCVGPSLDEPFPSISWDSDQDVTDDQLPEEDAAALSQSLFSKKSGHRRGNAAATLLRSKAMFCLVEFQASAMLGRKEDTANSLPFLLVG